MEGTWVGVAALFVSGLFAYLNSRDSKKNSSEITELRVQNTVQAQQIATNTVALRVCQGEHDETRQKLEECKDQHNKTDEELKRAFQRLTHLEEVVSKKKDDTSPHKTL